MDFFGNIEKILKERKISKSKLAQMIGKSPQTLNSIFKNKNPTQETINLISKALDIDLSVFMKDSYSPPVGMVSIPMTEYIELLEMKARLATERAEKAEKEVKGLKNIEYVPI